MTEISRITPEIFTIRGICSKQECDHWIAHSETLGYEAAMVNTERGPRRIEDVRNNARVIVDEPIITADLWSRVASNIPYALDSWKAIGLNPRVRYYRYDVGQKFDWHADGSIRLDSGEKSLVTFMVYLNDDFCGGETLFRGGRRIKPEKGMALLFTHWQKHMGNEVTEGRKYVLRSDVMYRHCV